MVFGWFSASERQHPRRRRLRERRWREERHSMDAMARRLRAVMEERALGVVPEEESGQEELAPGV